MVRTQKLEHSMASPECRKEGNTDCLTRRDFLRLSLASGVVAGLTAQSFLNTLSRYSLDSSERKSQQVRIKDDEEKYLAEKIDVVTKPPSSEGYVLEYGKRRFRAELDKEVASKVILISAELMAGESGKDKVFNFIENFGLVVELTHREGAELRYRPIALVDQPLISLPEGYLRILLELWLSCQATKRLSTKPSTFAWIP